MKWHLNSANQLIICEQNFGRNIYVHVRVGMRIKCNSQGQKGGWIEVEIHRTELLRGREGRQRLENLNVLSVYATVLFLSDVFKNEIGVAALA